MQNKTESPDQILKSFETDWKKREDCLSLLLKNIALETQQSNTLLQLLEIPKQAS